MRIFIENTFLFSYVRIMAKCFIFILLTCCLALGGGLPNVAKHPWFKTYNGFSLRKADVKLTTEGEVIVYPMIEEKRVAESKAIVVSVWIEFKAKGSDSWSKKTIRKDGFETLEPAEAPREKVEIVGTVTGDVQYKLRLEHDRKGVNIFTEFVEMPDYSKGQYKLTLVAKCPDLYSISTSEKPRTVSSKTRGDALILIPVHDDDMRKKRYKLNSKVDLSPYEKAGIQSIALKASRYGENDLLWKLVDPQKGTLTLTPKNAYTGLHKGFEVKTTLVDQTGELQSKGLRVEVD